MKDKSLERRATEYMMLLGAAVIVLELLVLILLAERLPGKMRIMLLAGFAAADAGLVLLWWFRIRRPANIVRKQMLDFLQGATFQELFTPAYHLTKEHPWVMEKLHELINSETMLELTMEHARYLALQNQINPHFLYNTLDAIRTDALLAGVKPVAKTTEALATYFRYTISNMDRYATLNEELQNVEDYMTIQQYRFGDKLCLNLDQIDPESREYCLPRMTLQPLVENAIYHGLEAKRKMGTVSVQAHTTEQLLIIHVTDDGIGMDAAKAERLNATLGRADSGHSASDQKRGGIALRNVNSRIKLLFGEMYGIQVFSEPDVGTDVRITLPVLRRADL